MLLSVLSEGIESSCLAHFSSGQQRFAEVQGHLKFLFRTPVSGKEAIYNMHFCHVNSVTMATETYTLKLFYLKAS